MSDKGWPTFRDELRQGEVSPHTVLTEHPAPARPLVETLMLYLTGDYQQHHQHPLDLARRIISANGATVELAVDDLTDDQRLTVSADLMHVRLHGSPPS